MGDNFAAAVTAKRAHREYVNPPANQSPPDRITEMEITMVMTPSVSKGRSGHFQGIRTPFIYEMLALPPTTHIAAQFCPIFIVNQHEHETNIHFYTLHHGFMGLFGAGMSTLPEQQLTGWGDTAKMATLPPELNIPSSTSTVNVSIINSSGIIRGVSAWRIIEPSIEGHEWLATPCYSFFIQHPKLNRSLVFDLGIKKDWENFPPPLLERFKKGGYTLIVPKHVREILDDEGIDTKSIEAVVWSHWHFDHTGNPSTFEPSTKLIVGPGCKDKIFPGYPENRMAAFCQADVDGREIREIDFAVSELKIGRFDAIDYFGDGSFYFLDSPGHAIGHVCGLARVTSDPDSFILMGGDAVHHGGELRPHTWHPLPDSVTPHPFTVTNSPCPGELFESLLRDGKEQPFYLPAKPPNAPQTHYDVPEMIESIKKLQECDAHDNILVVPAHDESLLRVAEFFPKLANGFVKKGWVKQARWAFLKDFAKAVGYQGELVGKTDFSPV
ncbi:beta-lactamase-like protein [Xylariales sp. AK1849]|nr:beta-lactamase-like protein [Xylariales sp. AK1849]